MRAARRMLFVLLAALPLAAAAAGGAEAASFKEARFNATYSFGRTINWEVPRHSAFQDCWHTWWNWGSGSDVETQASSKPIRVLASGAGIDGGSIFFKYRTWSKFDESGIGMPGDGLITREENRERTWTAGTCGVRGVIIDDEGNETMDPPKPPPNDCGERWAAFEGHLSQRGNKMYLSTFLGPRQETSFDSCETLVPRGMSSRGPVDGVGAPFSARDLFDPKRRVLTYTVYRTWSEDRPLPGGAKTHIFGSMRWTITLRRVGGAPVRKPGRKKPRR